MYQSVDDPPFEDEDLHGDRLRRTRPLLWGIMVITSGLLAFAGFTYLNHDNTNLSGDDSLRLAELASYRIALVEPSPALRRARLTDFIQTYPETDRQDAVMAQLAVLDTEESHHWAALSEIIFDPNRSNSDKLYALDIYEREWGPSYLGGRDTEIAQLRTDLATAPEPQPSRKLKGNKSSIPQTTPDNALVGGPVIITPPPPSPAPPPIVTSPVTSNIIPPKVRRNIRPEYPNNARRKNIGAIVELSLNIDEKGRVKIAEVISVKAERYEKSFARAARRAARRTRYFPQTVDNQPQAVSGFRKRYVFQAAKKN